jgi:DNA-binding NarL/FixJ family response regulator
MALTGRLIADALSHNPNFKIAAHVSSAEAVVAFTTHVQVHVALIGITFVKAHDGVEVLQRLRSSKPTIRSIMLLDVPSPDLVVECFRSGTKGVFRTSSDGYEVLCKCIQCVHDGQIWASSQEINWVMDSLWDSSVGTSAQLVGKRSAGMDRCKLSPRETEIVSLLTDGLTNRDIARTLRLSENTVRNHLVRIFEKLGVSSRTELVLHSFGTSGRVVQLERPRK